MGKGRGEEYKEDLGEKLSAPPDFAGPANPDTRKTTDILFLVLIIIAWIAMTGIGADAAQRGNLDRLLNGVDTDGKICGVDSAVSDLPHLYYVNHFLNARCVDGCPDETVLGEANQNITSGGAEAASSGAESYSVDARGFSFNGKAVCIPYSGTATFASLQLNGACVAAFDTTEVINRCIFTNKEVKDSILDNLDENKFVRNALSDILVTREVIFGFGFCVALVLGFIFLLLLELPGLVFIIVWFMVVGVLAISVALGYFAIQQAEDWKDDDSREGYEIRGLQAVGSLAIILGVLFFCLVLCLRNRINLAIGLVKEAARAMRDMRTLLLVPVLQAVGLVLFLLPWFYYVFFLASLGKTSTNEITINGNTVQAREFNFDEEVTRSIWYMLFIYFWTSQFIIAVGDMTVSAAIATWYFTRDKSNVGSGTPFSSLALVLRFHMGTCAFGALIIAIVKMIRAVIAYFQKKAKESGNKVAEYILCCCQCCIWCVEKCLKFLNKNAYIQTAIFGSGFCTAAKDAFFLILRNFARVGAVTVVSEFVMFIGKIFIVGVACAGSYFIIDEYMVDKVNGLFLPVLFVAFLAYYTADFFLDIYSMAILTLLQCFIADEEMFGAGPQSFAHEELKQYIADHAAEQSQKKADFAG